MKSLFKTLWAFLKSIFGGNSDKDSDKDNDPGQSDPKPPTQWDLVRYDVGKVDTLGKLYYNNEFVCYTLESTTDRANLGTYDLDLRSRGGLHATYGFRFGEMHIGVLHILTADEQAFRFVRTGNTATDAQGGLLLGKNIQNAEAQETAREIWHSEDAYREVYPQIAKRIASGEKITLKIALDREG